MEKQGQLPVCTVGIEMLQQSKENKSLEKTKKDMNIGNDKNSDSLKIDHPLKRKDFSTKEKNSNDHQISPQKRIATNAMEVYKWWGKAIDKQKTTYSIYNMTSIIILECILHHIFN